MHTLIYSKELSSSLYLYVVATQHTCIAIGMQLHAVFRKEYHVNYNSLSPLSRGRRHVVSVKMATELDHRSSDSDGEL